MSSVRTWSKEDRVRIACFTLDYLLFLAGIHLQTTIWTLLKKITASESQLLFHANIGVFCTSFDANEIESVNLLNAQKK